MKKFVMKKSLIVLIISTILMCVLSTISLADTQQIDLSNLDSIPEATPTPTATPSKTTTQTKDNALPQTGSNTEIIFVVGLVALAGVSIFMYKRTRIF